MKGVLSTFAFTYHLAEIQDAASVTNLANDFLALPRQAPFFLFLHYWDTHTPYHCPRGFLPNGTDRRDRKAFLTGRYAEAVRYVDFQLGRLFEKLKERKLWENTLLVVTSDHGDSLTEHDIYFDHHGLYDESTHVPLILHYPAWWTRPRRLRGFVQHIDLLPTICATASLAPPPGLDGLSLLPIIEGSLDQLRDAVFSEESYVQRKAALRTNRYKYIQALDGQGWCRYCEKVHVGMEELYDLENDPGETRDLSSSHRAVAEQMKIRLNAIITELDRKRDENRVADDSQAPGSPATLAPAEEALIKERLKRLGYL
jgi:arylsulfatase A-like enzyme